MDCTERVIEKIRQMPTPPDHVGEVIPQGFVRYPYVFITKSGEVYAEELCHPPSKESISYDVEVISDDINAARSLAASVKHWLRNTPIQSLVFVNDDGNQQTIHGILVDDHDDSYIPKVPDSDERIYIAAIDVEVILGEIKW